MGEYSYKGIFIVRRTCVPALSYCISHLKVVYFPKEKISFYTRHKTLYKVITNL
jgi:hypothetical protein